ncbi:MAG: hypothetical protein DRG24_05485 [Epsilonproteobacteria bacterium]|nr:MAG: hypothetical protein DRG24_05485 [Campylobacterota bacterium]
MQTYCYGIVASILIIALALIFKMKNKYKIELSEKIAESEVNAEMKELFLANISHETRTPLNVIMGLTHLLQKTQLDDVQKKHLETIERSSKLLLSITNEILEFSKIESGKMQINHDAFDLNDVLEDVAHMIVIDAKAKGLELIFDVAPDIDSSVNGDPLRLTQVLINLLNNAVKFTEKGSVTLRIVKIAENGEQTLRFEIIDTGIGMTEEQISKVFDAFTQADSRVSRKFGGTGLGLAITSELVKMMKGELDVASTLRHGSTFSVLLTFPSAPKQENKGQKYISRLLMEKEILIIDQSGSVKVLANLLTSFGAKVMIATGKDEIAKQLKFNHLDVVMVDESFDLDESTKKQIQQKSDHMVYMVYGEPMHYDGAISLFKPFVPLKVQNVMSSLFDKSAKKQVLKKEIYTHEDITVLGGSRILHAEDNEGNRMVVQGLLDHSNITIIEAENGQKAVEKMLNASEAFDLVLMDINMPVMDGYVATSIIREYQKFDHIPIVAITANITQTQMDKAKSYGMQDYLNKPIDTEKFYKKLLQYIPAKKQKQKQSMTVSKLETGASSSRIASLPGVDIEAGLHRVNNNEKIYKDILFKFYEIFKESILELKRMLDKEAYKEAKDYAHNLKGLAGNIGADTIYEIARDLDTACLEESDHALTVLMELKAELTPLLEAIKNEMQKHETKKIEGKIIPEEVLKQFLQQLDEAAGRQKGRDAKKVCEALTQYQWPPDRQKILSTIVKASKEYDFKTVQNLIKIMRVS